MKYPSFRGKSRKNSPSRQVKEVVLIVYEGKSTEYNYIFGIQKEYRYSNVLLRGPYSDPKTLIQETKKILTQKEGIDRAYCVFDHDGRKSFQSALELINEHNKMYPIKIEPITSNPCFEIWLLLHYIYSTRCYPTHPVGKKASDSLSKAIRKHLPSYRKNLETIYQDTKKQIPKAIIHAEKLSAYQKHDCTKNPYTDVHKLVKMLLSLPHSKT